MALEDILTAEPESDPVSPDPEKPATSDDETAVVEKPTQAEDDSEDEGSEEDSAKGGSSTYDKLLSKFGGDKEKMAQAVFDSYNSTARTHEELREMKALLNEIRERNNAEPEVDEAAAVAEDPDVKEIQSEMASIQKSAQGIRDRLKDLNVQYYNSEKKLERLQGKLEVAEESQQYSLREEIRELRSDMKDMSSESRSIQQQYAQLESSYQKNVRDLKKAEAEARSRLDREKAEATTLQREAYVARHEYNDALRDAAKRFGIDPDSKTYNFINATFRTQIRDHMQTLKQRGVTEGIDIPGAVNYLMEEYAEAVQLKPKFAKLSKEKAEVTSKPGEVKVESPESRGRVAKGEQKHDAAYYKQRAKQLLG